MIRQPRQRTGRRGAVAVLLAILMIPLIAMVAFAVDVAWMVLSESDLQNAADSAALAGASQLQDGYVQYYLAGQTQQAAIVTTATANARQKAKEYAGYNAAGGVSSLALNDNDIEFGYTDAQGNYTPQAQTNNYPNTIKVTMRRDATANGPLALFFGPALGTSTTNLKATASATVYAGVIDSFKTNGTPRILPMTYDVNHWNNFLQTGQGPDGTTDTAANGAPQLQVYPSIKFTGNFGLLSLDQGNDGASTISGWINNGVSSGDLANEVNAGLLPLSSHNPASWDWKGNPGLKTSDIHSLQAQVGQHYLLPLFKPLNDGSVDPTLYAAGTGNGSHYFYNIVQFVGITITQVDNKSVHVQPYAYLEPSAVLTNLTPAGPPTNNGNNGNNGNKVLTTTLAPAKMTR